MFGNRRLAKRSIVGTRVAARWQDGRYYPGVIEGEYSEESPFTDAVYTIRFEDGYQKNIPSKSIIGPGFQTTSSAVLKKGQKVFLTLNGREVTGLVINHWSETDEVEVSAVLTSGDEMIVTKRLEEVRLMKSRKSARLADQDTDYSKLADLQLGESKKRTVSSGIDVPNKIMRQRHSSRDVQKSDDQTYDSSSRMDDDDDGSDVEMMDENVAAMVLSNLSCSPQSPQDFRDIAKHGFYSTSASSSGFYSNQSERSDPSPPTPSHLSESAPAGTAMMFGPYQQDEGVELENGNKMTVKRTMYQCTWPGCQKISSTTAGIEKHIRDQHLKLEQREEVQRDDSETDSCGEEEFYYTEIEVNVDNVTQGFSDMCSSEISPTVETHSESFNFVIPDHDYQKKEYRQGFASSVPSTSTLFTQTRAMPMPIPIKVSEIQRSLSWQNTHTYATSPSPPMRISNKPSPQERLQQHQAQSPKIHTFPASKTLSIHKKPRSEVRKCRKVYGMENRDMWCTQCKWKKACTRFLD